MRINIKATGIELTGAISDYVSKKISALDKFIDERHQDVVVEMEVGKSTKHHKSGLVFRAEIHISGGGLDLYAVSEQDDLYAAIDLVKDEIIHGLYQLKGRRETVTRKSARLMKNMMKGLSEGTVKGLTWGMERIKFRNFKRRQ